MLYWIPPPRESTFCWLFGSNEGKRFLYLIIIIYQGYCVLCELFYPLSFIEGYNNCGVSGSPSIQRTTTWIRVSSSCSPPAPMTTSANTIRRIRHPACRPSCRARGDADCAPVYWPDPEPRPGISLCLYSRPACTKGTSRPSSICTRSLRLRHDALTWKGIRAGH